MEHRRQQDALPLGDGAADDELVLVAIVEVEVNQWRRLEL